MSDIEWKILSPVTLYFVHDKYVFKKRRLKNYFVYSAWENGELLFNTVIEREFLQLAGDIVKATVPPATQVQRCPDRDAFIVPVAKTVAYVGMKRGIALEEG